MIHLSRRLAATPFSTQKLSTHTQKKILKIAVKAGDKYDTNNLNPFLISRINNAMVQGFNEAPYMPKIVIIVIEDDIINDVTYFG